MKIVPIILVFSMLFSNSAAPQKTSKEDENGFFGLALMEDGSVGSISWSDDFEKVKGMLPEGYEYHEDLEIFPRAFVKIEQPAENHEIADRIIYLYFNNDGDDNIDGIIINYFLRDPEKTLKAKVFFSAYFDSYNEMFENGEILHDTDKDIDICTWTSTKTNIKMTRQSEMVFLEYTPLEDD